MNNKFSENIKKIRKDNNLSQEELAEQLGVSRQAISKWESSVAYPEMDKIIQICDKFGVNIDDLLHKDIKEVKGEEETKNKVNKYIDDFFAFITNTVKLFENMSFKSKIKCLFEQCIICIILFIILSIINLIGGEVFYHLLYEVLPHKAYYISMSLLESIYLLFAFVCGIVIMVHIFNIRYLEYFKSIKSGYDKKNKDDNNSDKNINININEDKDTSNLSINEQNRIIFKNNKEKIIIRDPSHSEYNFLNGLIKLMLWGIKFCAFWVELWLCFSIICIAGSAVASFLIIKTGIFFIGVLSGLIALGILNIVLILLLFNFMFDRRNNKKIMIWSSIISIIIIGASCGLIAVGFLNFDVKEYPDEEATVKYIEIEMFDKAYIDGYMDRNGTEFVVDNTRNNIKIEYDTYEEYELNYYVSDYGNIHVWPECKNPMKVVRQFIDNVNNKKIITFGSYPENAKIRVYASEANINKLVTNYNNHYNLEKAYEEQLEKYEARENELELELDEANLKINRLEDRIDEYRSLLNEYRDYDE